MRRERAERRATANGQLSPDSVDGQIAGVPLPQFLLPVTVDGGLSILYAGPAPGLVQGAAQINLQLPQGSGVFNLKAGDLSTPISIAIH